jgi:hypothetical protein
LWLGLSFAPRVGCVAEDRSVLLLCFGILFSLLTKPPLTSLLQWVQMSRKFITWFQPFSKVLQGSLVDGSTAWFLDGKVNVRLAVSGTSDYVTHLCSIWVRRATIALTAMLKLVAGAKLP